ncbi:MAG: AbrB/MazE/SpoVT family DNA-binding domain-containing protein [Desulfamplus sp.]|nr:AbrB/MazE/SpoVT family DNA-binding domain-containing protein [Desulfamplus sp.]
MIALKVRKIGNSLGVVLPKASLEKLKVKEGETLYFIESDDVGYRLTGYNENFFRQVLEAEKIMQQDKDLLRELSKR